MFFSLRFDKKMESTRLEGGMTKNNLESRSFSMSIGVVRTLKMEEKRNVEVRRHKGMKTDKNVILTTAPLQQQCVFLKPSTFITIFE